MKEQLFCVICNKELQGQQKMYCSNNCKQKAHYEKENAGNTMHSQDRRALIRKMKLIMEFGGKCSVCGYNKNISALDFHHKESFTKSFQLDKRTLSNLSWDNILEEAKKCELLCSNCHREIHNPETTFDNTNLLISEFELKVTNKVLNTLESGSICPVCQSRFPKVSGKTYCSTECRQKDKGYPSLVELEEQYKILKSWEKVGVVFNVSRKIIAKIRKDEKNNFNDTTIM